MLCGDLSSAAARQRKCKMAAPSGSAQRCHVLYVRICEYIVIYEMSEMQGTSGKLIFIVLLYFRYYEKIRNNMSA